MAEGLHAEDFASDGTVKLEADGHLAAVGEGAVLAEEDDVENVFGGVKGDSEGKSGLR